MKNKEINNGKEPKYKYVYVVTYASYNNKYKTLGSDVYGVYNSFEDAQHKMYKMANSWRLYLNRFHDSVELDICDIWAKLNIDKGGEYICIWIHKKKIK